MKEKLTIAAGITLAALAHITPIAAILMIAVGNEPIRAIGAGVCFVSTFALGYIHGKNGSLDKR